LVGLSDSDVNPNVANAGGLQRQGIQGELLRILGNTEDDVASAFPKGKQKEEKIPTSIIH
jgi:hypothetical protein